METNPDFNKGVKVEVDAHLVNSLDRYRSHCPTINRSALVNMILLDWAQEQRIRRNRASK